MARYKFLPLNKGASPANSAAGSSPHFAMEFGGEYEVDDGWAEHINRLYDGIDDEPALVPVAAKVAPPAPKGKPGPKPKPAAETSDPGTETT